MRLIQLEGPDGRRTGLVEEPRIRLFIGKESVYDLAHRCIRDGGNLEDVVCLALGDERLDYDPIYEGKSEWRILLPIEHPVDSAHCLVSGTGLTHNASAKNRDAMHAAALQNAAAVTDSTRMYQMGVQGGKPKEGEVGASPEWFYKGNGNVLRPYGHPLTVPAFAEDGGEEPEVAGVYIIGDDGVPYRVGLTVGNEFSDHLFERRNYLYLASSKLRECSIGPELVVAGNFQHLHGTVRIEREGETLWTQALQSGEANMCHSLANIEHHHFKFPAHRRPGDLHIHYFGADAFSFGEGVQLADGDVMHVEWDGFGRALRNPVKRTDEDPSPISVREL